jgi:methylase of polypeptide subunit release factors
MSGQPENHETRYYALEKLGELQKQIPQLAQAMVVQRARIENYRQKSDLSNARGVYTELQSARKKLVNALTDAGLLLMEAEEYSSARTSEKMAEGLAGFDLMSTNYKPVYEALCQCAASFPTPGTTTNAAVIGRLMNNVKMGYYPTDPDNISLILQGIRFPAGVTTNLLDPCCGCGKALRQLAQGNNCYAYGVELDESRAEEAQTRLHRVGFGSFFHSRISHEAFHLLFLNPPYLSVLNESGSRSRHEKRFLIESLPHLAYGGLLIYVIPYYRLTSDICRILCDNFRDLAVWRFTDSEFKKFKQVAILGLRKHRNAETGDTKWLERYAFEPSAIPSLSELSAQQYALPAEPLTVSIFQGELFNEKELEQQLRKSNSFEQMMQHSQLDNGIKHPLLPLSISQIGLIGGSGMINGLIQCESPHIIKGRIVKVVHTETEDQFSHRGKHIGSEVKETISNKMIFNVLTPNGFRSLA